MQNKNNHLAFTLIEILMVVVIIAILAVISVPSYLQFREQSRLNFSSQLLQTELQKQFSSARSFSRVFGLRGMADSDVFTIYLCEALDCSDQSDIESQELQSSIIFESPVSFDVRFFPPHGDLKFFNDDGTEKISEDLDIEIKGGGGTKSIKIYKKSGFIEKS